MYSKKTIVCNETGIHARPANLFTNAAKNFSSKITIVNLKTGKEANAKSILITLTLAITKGTEVLIHAEGEDEKTAVNHLIELIDSGLGELDNGDH